MSEFNIKNPGTLTINEAGGKKTTGSQLEKDRNALVNKINKVET